MKKLFTLMLVVVLGIACLGTGCKKDGSDLEAVKEAGKIVVGVTIYPPMDYIDENTGDWTGFDAELAKMFAEEIGVNCQITIITWVNKVAELNSNQIDLVWNGMTASDELGEQIDFSVSYAKNTQVAVVKTTSSITTKEQIKTSKVAVEQGSAADMVTSDEGMTNVSKPAAQVDALNEVNAGTSEVAIVDFTMAQSVVGKDQYSGLKIVDGVRYGDEIFAVGLRKGSDLKGELDAFLKAKYADGTMTALALKYKVDLNTEALGA